MLREPFQIFIADGHALVHRAAKCRTFFAIEIHAFFSRTCRARWSNGFDFFAFGYNGIFHHNLIVAARAKKENRESNKSFAVFVQKLCSFATYFFLAAFFVEDLAAPLAAGFLAALAGDLADDFAAAFFAAGFAAAFAGAFTAVLEGAFFAVGFAAVFAGAFALDFAGDFAAVFAGDLAAAFVVGLAVDLAGAFADDLAGDLTGDFVAFASVAEDDFADFFGVAILCAS
jgi:hypothetical protein